MGLLIDGVWQDRWYDTKSTGGRFERQQSRYRNWVTADGYFAAPDGNLDCVVPDEEQARASAREIPNFDTVLFGRRTYEIFEGFWGHVVVDHAGTVANPHHPRRRSPEHGIGRIQPNQT